LLQFCFRPLTFCYYCFKTTGSIFLESDDKDDVDGAAVHWSIKDDTIEIGFAVRATGWVGLGLSENGGMHGADMVIFEAANPDTLMDAFNLEERNPQMDDCQNWELVNSSTETDFLIVQVKRKLNTGDTQDYSILEDSNLATPIQRVISAWGDSSSFGYHGDKNARGAIRWFLFGEDEASSFQEMMDEQAEGSFSLEENNYTLDPVDTEYINYCITDEDILSQGVPLDAGVTLIGFEPIITSPYVHHYTVYASRSGNSNITCNNDNGDYMELVYVWAPGEPPQILPDNVGMLVGGADGFRSFMIEYHYNNPDLLTDAVDNSGLRFHYSLSPREHELGEYRDLFSYSQHTKSHTIIRYHAGW
jgi:dopamine beta-monooxygenase